VPDWEDCVAAVAFVSGFGQAELTGTAGPQKRPLTQWRGVMAYIAVDEAGVGLAELAARCGRSRSWATQTVHRIERQLDRTSAHYDPGLVVAIGRARQAIGLGVQAKMGDQLPENVVSLAAHRRARSA